MSGPDYFPPLGNDQCAHILGASMFTPELHPLAALRMFSAFILKVVLCKKLQPVLDCPRTLVAN